MTRANERELRNAVRDLKEDEEPTEEERTEIVKRAFMARLYQEEDALTDREWRIANETIRANAEADQEEGGEQA